MMDMVGCCHGGIGFISGGYGVPNLTDINSEGLSNVFSSPRNTPFFAANYHVRQRDHHPNDYLELGSSALGGENNQSRQGNFTEDNMYIHYNNNYQPQHQCDHASNHYPDDRLYCESGVHSPNGHHDSLSVLADTFIASAEKDRRQKGVLSMVGKTIYSSEQDSNYQGVNTTVGELSRIIKSDDSPTTSLQDGSQLVDVSFSTLADLSMLRTGSPSAIHLSTHDMSHNIVLSPIDPKSPDISMTPYLNCLTLDCSSQGSRPSEMNCRTDAAFNAVPSTSEPLQELPNLNRSLFSTSSKRKRVSITDSSVDADLLNLTNVAHFNSNDAASSMR